MTMIPLTKNGGLTPHMCKCPNCGADTDEITIGAIIMGIDSNSNEHFTQKGKGRQYNKDNSLVLDWTELDPDDNRRIPMSLCEDCEKEINMQIQLVKEGGLLFKCDECNATGVIKSSEFTIQLKKDQGIPFDKPLGIAFHNCSEHEVEKEGEHNVH